MNRRSNEVVSRPTTFPGSVLALLDPSSSSHSNFTHPPNASSTLDQPRNLALLTRPLTPTPPDDQEVPGGMSSAARMGALIAQASLSALRREAGVRRMEHSAVTVVVPLNEETHDGARSMRVDEGVRLDAIASIGSRGERVLEPGSGVRLGWEGEREVVVPVVGWARLDKNGDEMEWVRERVGLKNELRLIGR